MLATQTLILGLTASVAAIDLNFYSEQNCNGIAAVYTGISPDRCYGLSTQYRSGLFYYIPSDWDIQCRAYSSTGCGINNRWGAIWSNGNTRVCMTGGGRAFAGAGYGFSGKKRDAAAEGETGGEPCASPDFLELEDGTMFDMKGLSAEEIASLWDRATAGESLIEELADRRS